MVKYAILFSGYIGNINRSLNSVKKNICYDSNDSTDLFIMTRNFNTNIIKCINKNTGFIDYKNGQVYTAEQIQSMTNFPIKSITEYELDPIGNDYQEKEDKFVERTKNYISHTNLVINYDKVRKRVSKSTLKAIFEQYYLVSKCLTKIIDYENKNNFKYDYIIRVRDRQTIQIKIEKEKYIDKGLSLLGYGSNPLYVMESFFIGERDSVINGFIDLPDYIGSYRIPRSKFKLGEGDTTLSAESQVALHLFNIFGENINFLQMGHYVEKLDQSDGFGPPVIDDDDYIETDLQIKILQ